MIWSHSPMSNSGLSAGGGQAGRACACWEAAVGDSTLHAADKQPGLRQRVASMWTVHKHTCVLVRMQHMRWLEEIAGGGGGGGAAPSQHPPTHP